MRSIKSLFEVYNAWNFLAKYRKPHITPEQNGEIKEVDTLEILPSNIKLSDDRDGLIKKEIKRVWPLLADEDIDLYESNPDVFFDRIKDKHAFNRDQAQKRLNNIKSTTLGKVPEAV